MDPYHGELSRAMRNRCIEIHLPSENFSESMSTADAENKIEAQGLTWDEAHLINKSKCTNTTELILSEKTQESAGRRKKIKVFSFEFPNFFLEHCSRVFNCLSKC